MIDRDEVLERVGGDEELLAELVATFLEECPGMVAGIRRAVERQDAAGLQAAAHALKGAASNFGAQPVVEAALALESMGRSADLGGATEAYQRLDGALGQLTPALERLTGGS